MLTAPYSLAIGAAAIVGAAVGVQLGNSTISAIKPSFFLGPAVHPRERGVAIDPREIEARRLASQPRYAALYGWDEGNRALELACSQCGRPAADVASAYDARVPYFGSREERLAEARAEQEAIDRRYEARLEAIAELEGDAEFLEAEPIEERPLEPEPTPFG